MKESVKQFVHTTAKVSLTLLFSVALLTSCNDESTELITESTSNEIVVELTKSEADQLGLSPQEAADLSLTTAEIENRINGGKANKNVRLGSSWSISKEDVFDLQGDLVGFSKLIRFSQGVIPIFYTNGVTPGTATTLWATVYNNPADCTIPCSLDDAFNPSVMADGLWAKAGRKIGRRGVGLYWSFLAINDGSTSVFPFILGVNNPGITNPMEAEVLLSIRDHGPALEEYLESQLTTFNGGCQFIGLPEVPELGVPGPNTCQDILFSLHAAN